MRTITFKITFDAEGNAIIRLPEGPGQQRDAATVADLTAKLAAAMGEVAERHIGAHHHHDHAHEQEHEHV